MPSDPTEPSEELRQRMMLVGQSYADWQAEVRRIVEAADVAEMVGGKFVDANNLTRAFELADLMTAEIHGLEDVSLDLPGAAGAQVAGIRDRLIALRDELRDAMRRLHGMTG